MSSQADSLRSKRLATAAIFSALALIFSYVEAMIPIPLGIPGVKLGLANLIIVVALYKFGFKYALLINLIRISVSGLLFNGLFGTVYALAGGLLSLCVMWVLKKSDRFSIVGVSMAGGFSHNIGQLLTASAIVSNLRLFIYLPVLMFSGIISGILIGFIAYYMDASLAKAKI